MPLNLYRRHSRIEGKCVGGHAADSRNYEPEELRRAWKKCHCPIYADGTLAGQFRRRNTKKAIWEEAKTLVAAWEAAGRWDISTPSPTPVAAPPTSGIPPSPGRPTIAIEFAIHAYLTNRAGRDIAQSTLRKYNTFAKQLRAFSATKGYAIVDQFSPVDMDEFLRQLERWCTREGQETLAPQWLL